MPRTISDQEYEELQVRRNLAAAQRSLSYYQDMNSGGRYGHGRGNFSDKVAEARGLVQANRQALDRLTRR
jgi:hypothetical protein